MLDRGERKRARVVHFVICFPLSIFNKSNAIVGQNESSKDSGVFSFDDVVAKALLFALDQKGLLDLLNGLVSFGRTGGLWLV